MKRQVWPTHSWSGTEPTEVNVTIIIIIKKKIFDPRYICSRGSLKIEIYKTGCRSISPCSQGLASCHVTRQRWSDALAPKLFGTEKLLPCHRLRMRRSVFPKYQRVGMLTCYYYYYYAAFNAPCVGHREDESQAWGSHGSTGSSWCNKTFWVSFWKCLQWRPRRRWWRAVDCSSYSSKPVPVPWFSVAAWKRRPVTSSPAASSLCATCCAALLVTRASMETRPAATATSPAPQTCHQLHSTQHTIQ